MAYLSAAVVLVGVIAAVNLLLTVGVIRRLREHTAQLAVLRGPAQEAAVPIGSPVGDFSARDVAGRPVDGQGLAGRSLIGFFSPGCAPCKEQLPGFVEQAARTTDTVLAVVAGEDPGETAETAERLGAVATVVVEPALGPVQRTFGVTSYPAFVLVRDGFVVAAGHTLADVAGREPTPATG
jgi:thiol-disulfide isomerase/thioredoxin